LTSPNRYPLNGTEEVGACLLAIRLKQMLAGKETFTAVQAGHELVSALKEKGFTISKE
jgi:hypothetical protein